MKENDAGMDTAEYSGKAGIDTVSSLIADLSSQDGLVRVRARKALVAFGSQAVKSLIKALSSKKRWVRWEAAKTLSQIGEPKATQALIMALEDKMFDVRWLAAEGLISIGPGALPPLIRALVDHPGSVWLQEGVHHVLHEVSNGDLARVLQPVIAALEGFEPSVEAPLAAERALDVLTK